MAERVLPSRLRRSNPTVELPPIVLTFAGGLNTRRSVTRINPDEAVAGANFDLDEQYESLRGRKPFDLVATATNAGDIRGYAQLKQQDGTVSTLIQAGDTMYEWDHGTTFTSRGTVDASSKMRGKRTHNFTLDEFVIITDLAELTVVKKWDGTTFGNLAHNLGGDFFARYCLVQHERAFFGNVKSGTATPHILVGSQRGDSEVLSVSDRPAGTLGIDSPFFIPMPNLKPINGMDEAFGTLVLSTDNGKLHQLVGNSAFDFVIRDFYEGSALSGAESMVNIGNDLALGLPGRIESLKGTQTFGDVNTDDLTNPVAPSVEGATSWTLNYNRTARRLYCFPDHRASCFVLYKPLLDARSPLSPWSEWTTGHSINFQPTTVFTLLHPSTLKEITYMGDSSGNIYQLEGVGSGDGGTTSLVVSRTTGLIQGFPDGSVFDVEGWINYRRNEAATVTLTFIFQGEAAFDKSLVINLPAAENQAVYNGTGTRVGYYNASAYYGAVFSDRISRQNFGPPGLNAYVQLKVEVESQAAVDIQNIGLSISTAK